MASAKVPGNFSSHSFRIGAATIPAENGVPDHLIQSMGCWSSNASLLYIRTPAEVLAALSKSWPDEVLGVPTVLSYHSSLVLIALCPWVSCLGLASFSKYVSLWLTLVLGFWCLGLGWGSEVPCHRCSRLPPFSKHLKEGFDWVVPAFQGCHGYLSAAMASGTPLTFKAPVPKLIYLWWV